MLQRAVVRAAIDLRTAGRSTRGVVCRDHATTEPSAAVRTPLPSASATSSKLVTVADLIEYRRRREARRARRLRAAATDYGQLLAIAYRRLLDGQRHVAPRKGDVEGAENVLVRAASSTCTATSSTRTSRLRRAARAGARADRGRGVALCTWPGGPRHRPPERLRPSAAAAGSTPWRRHRAGFPADSRWGSGDQILADLGLRRFASSRTTRGAHGLDGTAGRDRAVRLEGRADSGEQRTCART